MFRGFKKTIAGQIAMRFIRKRRVHKAKHLLYLMDMFPRKEVNAIISDYRYSISRTYRNILQVTNIETVIRYIVSNKIPGGLVETGTYTGGASAYMLRALLRLEHGSFREYWGFDSFEGMPTPTTEDGVEAMRWILGSRDSGPQTAGHLVGHSANATTYEECLRYLQGTRYPAEKIHLIKGWFQHMLPETKDKIGPIAVLRMDGDLYDSTKVALTELYDQIVSRGVVIIDDYGGFVGCRRAVDEFFDANPPHLVHVDKNIRYCIKP